MAEDFTDRFRFGLSNLPDEPPDNFGSPYSAGSRGLMGTPPLDAPQVVQAGYRLPFPGRLPPGPFPMPGQPVPPIRMPQIPEWWRPLAEVLKSLHPAIITGTFGANGQYDDDVCKEEWADAMDFCAKELSKLRPDRYKTGGHTSIEDCARGRVTERCGGNPMDNGDQKQPPKPSRRR